MANPPPFDPEALAEWLLTGLKETVSYRIKQTFNKEKIVEAFRAKIPSRSRLLHQILRKGFEQDGFKFEEIHQGDATFMLIRKTIRPGHRRLILIPGFGDSPASWLLSFGFTRRHFQKNFDEIVVLDFPGYLGFLSHQRLIPSMAILQSFVKTVCEANPPHTLIGHSLGGWLAGKYAQQLAAHPGPVTEHAQRLHNLILIAPSGLTRVEERKPFADFILEGQGLPMKEFLSRVVHEPKRYQVLLKDEFKHFYGQPEIRQFIESVKPEEFMDDTQPFGADHISVIWGDHDQFVPTRWMRHWIECYGPYLDAYMLKETGHLPQLERPQTLAEVVLHTLGLTSSPEGRYWKKLQSKKLSFRSSVSAKSEVKRISHQKA